MSDLYTERHSEDEILNLAELDSDEVISNLMEDVKCLNEDIQKLQAENAELKRRQLKDGDIAKVVNGVRLAISQVWCNPPQSLREIISKAVIRNLPTPPEGE